jgi:hypothetical protein
MGVGCNLGGDPYGALCADSFGDLGCDSRGGRGGDVTTVVGSAAIVSAACASSSTGATMGADTALRAAFLRFDLAMAPVSKPHFLVLKAQ